MNRNNDPSTIGVYADLQKAENAIDELRRAGFRQDEIGIIGHIQDGSVPSPPSVHPPEENAISGLLRGGVIGAIVGAFVILVIPGLGQVAGLGWWFDIVGGAALGAVMCGVMIAFGTLFLAGPRTRLYAAQLEKGNFIVTVKNPTRKQEAESVLRAQDVRLPADARR